MWERLFRLDKPDKDGVSDPPWREPKLRHYTWRVNPYMPVEFSVAAFRFGHSQVRNGYRINNLVAVPTFTPNPTPGRLEDLRGFRSLPPQWQVSWPHLFELDDTPPQPSRLINTKLAPALFELPGEPVDDVVRRSLPFRNLLRGKALQLPSGQAVAAAIGANVLTDEELGTAAPTPLWFYILKEAEVRASGQHLGEVGGRIVGETILGMLRADRLSFYSVAPDWQPGPDLGTAVAEAFDMAELLRFAVPDRATRF